MSRLIRKKRRLKDLCIVVFLVMFATSATILFRPDFLISTLLFFGVPSIFLIYRRPSNLLKTTLAALLLGVVWAFSFDYVAEFNKAWGWSSNTGLSLPVQFFGVVSLDILVWYFLWVFLTVSFYEYFADHDVTRKVSPNFKWSFMIGLMVALLVVVVSKFTPNLLTFQYAYLVLGIATLVPFAAIVIRRPSLFPKVMEIIPFFILLYLAFELTALYTGLWSFPGHYIGEVRVFGLSFPFEEMLFWVITSSAVTASYHEYIVGDGK